MPLWFRIQGPHSIVVSFFFFFLEDAQTWAPPPDHVLWFSRRGRWPRAQLCPIQGPGTMPCLLTEISFLGNFWWGGCGGGGVRRMGARSGEWGPHPQHTSQGKPHEQHPTYVFPLQGELNGNYQVWSLQTSWLMRWRTRMSYETITRGNLEALSRIEVWHNRPTW